MIQRTVAFIRDQLSSIRIVIQVTTNVIAALLLVLIVMVLCSIISNMVGGDSFNTHAGSLQMLGTMLIIIIMFDVFSEYMCNLTKVVIDQCQDSDIETRLFAYVSMWIVLVGLLLISCFFLGMGLAKITPWTLERLDQLRIFLCL